MDRLYIWGADHLNKNNQKTLECIQIPRVLLINFKVNQIAAGEEHALFLTVSGVVFSIGSNSEGQLGVNDQKLSFSNQAIEVTNLPECIQVACGWTHSIAVTNQGEVYSWGNGKYGALGYGGLRSQWQPILLQKNPSFQAIQASCGARHTAILGLEFNKGRVLACGAGEVGQLGIGRRDKEILPKYIQIQKSIKAIACGVFHTLLLSDKGKIFATGGNSFGQLGIGNKKTQYVPVQVSDFDGNDITKLSCGHHSAAITSKGEVFIWGTGIFGEYLNPQKVIITDENSKKKALKILDINIGGCFGSLIDQNGQIWTWGSNSCGELGQGDYLPRLQPTKVKSFEGCIVKQIACGGNFALAISQEVQPRKQQLKQSKTGQARQTSSQIQDYRQPANNNTRQYKNISQLDSSAGMNSFYEVIQNTQPEICIFINEMKEQLTMLQSGPGGIDELQKLLNQSIIDKDQLVKENIYCSDIIKKLQDENKALQRQLQQQMLEIEVLDKNQQNTQQEAFQLLSSKERMEQENMKLQNQLADNKKLRSYILELESQIQSQEAANIELSSKNKQHQVKQQELNSKISELQQSIKQSKSDIDFYQEELSVLNNKKGDIEEKYRQTQKQLDQSEFKLVQAQNQIKQLKSEIERLQSNVIRVEEIDQKKQSLINSQTKQIQEQDQMIKQLQRENKRVESLVQEKENKNLNLIDNLQISKARDYKQKVERLLQNGNASPQSKVKNSNSARQGNTRRSSYDKAFENNLRNQVEVVNENVDQQKDESVIQQESSDNAERYSNTPNDNSALDPVEIDTEVQNINHAAQRIKKILSHQATPNHKTKSKQLTYSCFTPLENKNFSRSDQLQFQSSPQIKDQLQASISNIKDKLDSLRKNKKHLQDKLQEFEKKL